MNPQKIAIITDSCAELTRELIGEAPVFVVPLRIRCSEGEFRDGVDVDAKKIYRLLKTELPKTSLPLPGDVEDVLDEIQAQGYEKVIAIMLSGGLSGTCNMVRLEGESREELEVRTFDSLSGATCVGAMVLQTAEYIARGVQWQELLRRVEYMIGHTWGFFSVDTLEYLQKGGRIGRITAMAGTLMNVKPVLTFSEDGQLVNIAKVRGMKQVEAKLVELAREARSRGQRFNLLVANGGAPAEMEILKAELIRQIPGYDHLYETEIDGTLSVYIGPGVLGSGIMLLDEMDDSQRKVEN